LYLQSCHGHRSIYATVFINWATDNSYKVVISSPDSIVIEFEKTNVHAVISKSSNHIDNVVCLEKKHHPDISLLANADFYIRNKEKLLAYEGAPQRIIIANYSLWAHDMEKRLYVNGSVIEKLKAVKAKFKLYFHRKREKDYYCNKLPNMGIAGLIASMDEYYVATAKHNKIVYIPDIYTIHGVYEKNQTQKDLVNLYSDFLKKHSDSEVILYLGQWQERRGLLELLKLTASKRKRVFVCVGNRMDGVQYNEEIEFIYKKLDNAGRVFISQTKYMNNGVFMDYVFNSVNLIVLPYKNFHGGSGSLITSASYGKPLLVPNYGHMRKTVKKYQIGTCYISGNLSSMEREYCKLIKSEVDYMDSCKRYAELFSKEKVYNSLDKAVSRCLQ